ncbi:ammonium transporter, partial [Enterococcus faecalis]|nr:ammonium transporter [Enterococcus faecalis]
MWLMIFGVILYYVGLVNHRYIHHTLILGLVTIISGTLCWLFVGYSLSFFGNIQYS